MGFCPDRLCSARTDAKHPQTSTVCQSDTQQPPPPPGCFCDGQDREARGPSGQPEEGGGRDDPCGFCFGKRKYVGQRGNKPGRCDSPPDARTPSEPSERLVGVCCRQEKRNQTKAAAALNAERRRLTLPECVKASAQHVSVPRRGLGTPSTIRRFMCRSFRIGFTIHRFALLST